MEIFDKIAEFCQKLCYIALAVLLLGTLANRVVAEEIKPGVIAPAAVTVETETNEASGLTKVTVYIRQFISDVQAKYSDIVSTTNEEASTTEAPKAS